MSAENKMPAIRFKGFSGEWEEKKIGSVLTEVRRSIELIDKEIYQLVTVKRRNQGVVPRALLEGRNILVKNYFVIKAGDYLISKRQVVHGANGMVPDDLDNAVVSNEYLVVVDSQDITAQFWTVISKRTEMHKIFFISSYGVDIEKLVFDVNDWKNREIILPKVTEQVRITRYFQQLDTLIAQHQQKHDKLLNLKKSLLEKMFPKQGATEPEIRFKGFSEAWEEKALGKYAKFRRGSFPQPYGNKEWYGGEGAMPFVQVVDITKKLKLVKDTKQKISIIAQPKSVLVAKGKVLVTLQGSIGRVAIAQYDTYVDRTLLIFEGFKKKTDSHYWAYIIQNKFDIEKKKAPGGTIKTITKEALSAFRVNIPEYKEQTKIGKLFKQLDTLLNQHQAQLKKLKHIKQACLEKMFV